MSPERERERERLEGVYCVMLMRSTARKACANVCEIMHCLETGVMGLLECVVEKREERERVWSGEDSLRAAVLCFFSLSLCVCM